MARKKKNQSKPNKKMAKKSASKKTLMKTTRMKTGIPQPKVRFIPSPLAAYFFVVGIFMVGAIAISIVAILSE